VSEAIIVTRALLPGDQKGIEELVAAHMDSGDNYCPVEGQTGDEWLSQGVGVCLSRIVATTPDGTIVGHIAVGTIPFAIKQSVLWHEKLGSEVKLMEIRRGLVHPDWKKKRVGAALSKAALKWVTERKGFPVAATLPDRVDSFAMLTHYQWEPFITIDTHLYPEVTLWVPPETLTQKILSNNNKTLRNI
jgi:GNAT superfamily N-acetyltransferase